MTRQSRRTWKRVETRTAKELNGKRSGATGVASVDVDAGLFAIECKSWRRGPGRVEAALRQAEAAARPGQVAVARLHTVGKVGGQDLAVMRWSDFLDLHGDGKPRLSELVEELRKQAAAGDPQARATLQVLAPEVAQEIDSESD